MQSIEHRKQSKPTKSSRQLVVQFLGRQAMLPVFVYGFPFDPRTYLITAPFSLLLDLFGSMFFSIKKVSCYIFNQNQIYILSCFSITQYKLPCMPLPANTAHPRLVTPLHLLKPSLFGMRTTSQPNFSIEGLYLPPEIKRERNL